MEKLGKHCEIAGKYSQKLRKGMEYAGKIEFLMWISPAKSGIYMIWPSKMEGELEKWRFEQYIWRLRVLPVNKVVLRII